MLQKIEIGVFMDEQSEVIREIVLEALAQSIEQFDDLYRELAK
jgi:hypothetical protein